MTVVKYLIAILLLVMTSACADNKSAQSPQALPDNPENRTVLAKRYLEIMPAKDLLHGLASRVSHSLPEKDRKAFTDIMESPAMEKEANRLLLENLVKNFTTGELNAMVVFYGSPDGQSALKKFGPLMAEVMPKIQQEVKKGMDAVQKPPEAAAPKPPPAQAQPAKPEPAKPEPAKPEPAKPAEKPKN
jgi:hypothetical protein